MERGLFLRTGAALLALGMWSFASPCAAQSDEERAAARTAATQGFAAEQAGQFKQAVELFERAEAIVHAPPHLLHIARSQAKLGHLVAAHEAYFKIVREQLPENAPSAFVEAQVAAKREIAELEPRIPTLMIVVEGGKGMVTLDGSPMSDALVGIARPIDPGRHELRAMGEHLASPPVTVKLAEGAHETVRLAMTPVPSGEASAGPPPPASEPSDAARSKKRSNVPAYVAWGIGGAGLVFGTVMMVINRGKRSDAEAICPAGPCPLSRKAEIDALDGDADRAALLSWVGYGVGVAGVAAGTVLFLLNQKGGGSERAGVSPWVGAGSAGVTGRF